MDKPLIYLASPYSHKDARVRQWRFDAAQNVVSQLILQGHLVYSPIVYSYQFATQFEGHSGRWDYWRDFDFKMIDACQELWVLTLDGWRESVGIKAEIEYANRFPYMQIKFIQEDLTFIPPQPKAMSQYFPATDEQE